VTVKLITVALGRMASDKKIGRAETTRRSIHALIDKRRALKPTRAPIVLVDEGAVAKPPREEADWGALWVLHS
jgi:hypothetical protein